MKQSRRRSPPLPACYVVSEEDNNSNNNTGRTTKNNATTTTTTSISVPYIDACGKRFWSDRFYLNAESSPPKSKKSESKLASLTSPTTDTNKVASTSSPDNTPSNNNNNLCCDCGSLQAPPMFPRVEFVKSLDLKAVVMGTFGINCEWFYHTFPKFGRRKKDSADDDDDTDEECIVPTMIFHGQRGLENNLRKIVHCNWDTTKFRPHNSKLKRTSSYVSSDNNKKKKNNDEKNKRETRMGVHHPKFMLLFEKSGNLVVIVTTSNLSKTSCSTVEGSWIQRFYRNRVGDSGRGSRKRNDHNDKQQAQTNDFGPVLQDFLLQLSEAAAHPSGRRKEVASTKPPTNNNSNKDKNKNNPKNNILPLSEFLSKHLGLNSLNEFSSSYNFESARAHLVPVIPGDYEYDSNNITPIASSSSASTDTNVNSNNNNDNRYYYGRQRVRYILNKLATCSPTISKNTKDKSKMDRLVLQPTSLGNNWTRFQLASLIREYMGYFDGDTTTTTTTTYSNSSSDVTKKQKQQVSKTRNNNNKQYFRNDDWVCRNTDIIWPTDQFLVNIALASSSRAAAAKKGSKKMKTIISPLMAATTRARRKQLSPTLDSFIFNSSKNFNSFDWEFISRMAVYYPSTPCQLVGNTTAKRERISSSGEATATKIEESNTRNTGNVKVKRECAGSGEAAVTIEDNNTLSTEQITVKRECIHTGNGEVAATVVDNNTLSTEDIAGKRDCSGSGKGTATFKENKTLNTINENNNTEELIKSPHFKSIARLFQNHAAMHKRNVPPADAYFSWFLMTSACLSHGAQGAVVDEDVVAKIRREYENDPSSRPISTSSSKSSSPSSLSPSPSPSSLPELVHLPVPYNIRPESYFEQQQGDDDGHDLPLMKYDPFFHEISDDNRCVGNMLLTPFGKNEVQQMLLEDNASSSNSNKRRKKEV
ncbi:hypothetical protein FRACYDRAFT_238235 [Fragilariopsis cylindrus CCMP1102]|uniref:Tyrosyl-DNA phosphodiesterase n=1 Tax=Fragilariopsis cylindrus CCMP1102 TaxID=635003 RepID=A0A1E7FI04_9STRA|nr:hypothetical protein FRACYDRAFT_238235 [Fragilariopsis cylindrus CCMP1102]|eukprot:OEU17809.1 hypothetical protein FRACYDRAFT_238235 [Fragilariopsis cylindrus CCMP1102]